MNATTPTEAATRAAERILEEWTCHAIAGYPDIVNAKAEQLAAVIDEEMRRDAHRSEGEPAAPDACPRCYGTGYVWRNIGGPTKPCAVCAGTGRVQAEPGDWPAPTAEDFPTPATAATAAKDHYRRALERAAVAEPHMSKAIAREALNLDGGSVLTHDHRIPSEYTEAVRDALRNGEPEVVSATLKLIENPADWCPACKSETPAPNPRCPTHTEPC